jgi:hypothetical protein
VAHPFRDAVEARDVEAMTRCLHPDVVFNSPVAFEPFNGREAVGRLLGLVAETFEDFRYTDEIAQDGSTALIFRARIGEREVEGLDFVRSDGDGLITDFTVMVRPLSAAIALAEAMAPKVQGAGLK